MKKFFVLLVLFVPLLVFGANTPQVTNITNSSRLYRTAVFLTAGNSYVIRTYGNTVDTVLYLLNSNNSQVAYNDDCGSNCVSPQINLNSTISFTPTATGSYYIVMRHYYSGIVGAVGDMKVFTNGVLSSSMTNLPVGGTRTSIQPWDAYSQTTPIVAWRKLHYYFFNRDKEATGGATANDTVIYLMSSSSITNYDDDSGAGNTSKITKTSGSCSTGCYVLGGAYPFTYNNESEGNAKLIVDVDTRFGDTDLDGLSDALETVLGTSSALLGGGDTDHDGLNDYSETVGSGYIALPWEGSSPTQKDVFVEVDYFGRVINGTYVNFFVNNEQYVRDQLTDSFDRHGDIRLHVDVDDHLGDMADTGTTLKFAILGNAPANPDPAAYYLGSMMSTDFTQTRSGIYHWVVAANRHTDAGTTSSGISYIPGNRLIVSLGRYPDGGSQEQYAGTTIHEMGHTFYYDFGPGPDSHNGNGNHDPDDNSILHRSIMNYNYQFESVPVNIPGDNIWRYSTDNSTNRSELDWSYTNVITGWTNTGANGCIADPYINNGCTSDANCAAGLVCDPATGVCHSPKLACKSAGAGATSTCDCTFEEWSLLDLTSGGHIVMSAFVAAGVISAENERENPVFGLRGVVVAENLEDLMNSGAKYGKLYEYRKSSSEDSSELTANEKFYTEENKKIARDAYISLLEKSGYKENEDYYITEDNEVMLIEKSEKK